MITNKGICENSFITRTEFLPYLAGATKNSKSKINENAETKETITGFIHTKDKLFKANVSGLFKND